MVVDPQRFDCARRGNLRVELVEFENPRRASPTLTPRVAHRRRFVVFRRRLPMHRTSLATPPTRRTSPMELPRPSPSTRVVGR